MQLGIGGVHGDVAWVAVPKQSIIAECLTIAIVVGMTKQCPECRTFVDDMAPRCEACGCQLPKAPVVSSSNWRKILSYGMVVVLAIALGVYLRT